MWCNSKCRLTPLALELQSEGDLALAVRYIRILVDDLAEGAAALVGVGTVELRPVEGVEVVHRENGLDLFTHVEVFSGVQAFHGEAGVSELTIISLGIAEKSLNARKHFY